MPKLCCVKLFRVRVRAWSKDPHMTCMYPPPPGPGPGTTPCCGVANNNHIDTNDDNIINKIQDLHELVDGVAVYDPQDAVLRLHFHPV